MTFVEKQTDPTSPMHWPGDMQADYLYPSGVAGDRFFKHIMKNDSFLAAKCSKCNKTYFPPRLYCEDCFCEIPENDWFEVPSAGTIKLSSTSSPPIFTFFSFLFISVTSSHFKTILFFLKGKSILFSSGLPRVVNIYGIPQGITGPFVFLKTRIFFFG